MFPTKFTASEVLSSVKNLTRKRLYELMNEGKLSYLLEEYGNKQRRVIEASELIRVFGDDFSGSPSKKQETKQLPSDEVSQKQIETQNFILETALLKMEIAILKAQLEQEQTERQRERLEAQAREQKAHEREAFLQHRLEKVSNTVHQQVLMIENFQKQATPSAPSPRPAPKRQRSLFDRIFWTES